MNRVRTSPIAGAIDRSRFPRAGSLDLARTLATEFAPARVRPVEVLRSPALDRRADPSGQTRIWLALEHLQVTGSFKVRGALFAMARAKQAGVREVVAASAGNHGAGVSYAASVLGMRATVVVPSTAPRVKRDKIAANGAELIMSTALHYDGAEAFAKALAARAGATFLSAYDDEDVVLGNGSSLGFEIVESVGGVPDRVIVPFGGGGLATGVAWALEGEHEAPRGDRRVWGVQSEASPAMEMSLAQNIAVEELVPSPTLAEGLEGGIAKNAFERARGVIAGVVVVAEAQIALCMRYAQSELGATIEGSAAASLVPVIAGLPDALRGGDVVVVLTGQNVDPDRFEQMAV